MEALEDFIPFPGRLLLIVNNKKFAALPPENQAQVQEAFQLVQNSNKELQQVNNALLKELAAEK